MKILLLDDSRSENNFFIFGGIILDSDVVMSFKYEVNKIICSDGSQRTEYKYNINDNIKNAEKCYTSQFIKQSCKGSPDFILQDSNILNHIKTEDTTTADFYLNSEKDKFIKNKIFDFIINNKYEKKFVYCIAPSINKLNNVERLNSYKKSMNICIDYFEKYLLKNNEKGIVLIDTISDAGSRKEVDTFLVNFKREKKFKRIELFLPQVISDELFTTNDIIMGALNEYLRKDSKSFYYSKMSVAIRDKLVYNIIGKNDLANDFYNKIKSKMDALEFDKSIN